MNILLLGKNGQLGWELERALASLGEVYALDRNTRGGDLADLDGLAKMVRSLAPDLVVNAAAYTAVDKAESETELARRINAHAPEVLAKEVFALGAWLVHYSTDYVFDGTGAKPWHELDSPGPLNYYGKSKLAGEVAIQASGCKHLIFRTSWVYGVYGTNFVKTILQLARQLNQLNIVADQIGAPTGAQFLADFSVHALNQAMRQPELGGLYHLVPTGETSWYDYAHFIVKHAKNLGEDLRLNTITAIPSSEYTTAAQRPLNSRLATTKFTERFSLHLPHWQPGICRVLEEILRINHEEA